MSLSTLLVLADGRLPAGAHAHSGGVEAAVAAGRIHDLPTLESFLVGRTSTSGTAAAAFAAASCRALTTRPVPHARSGDIEAAPLDRARLTALDNGARSAARVESLTDHRGALRDDSVRPAERITALDDGIDARTASPALRAASRAQGRALLRAVARIWPAAVNPAGPNPHHPIATGIAAAAAGLGPREAALTAVYGGLTGAASAAVRLLGLDPYTVHALIARLAPECDRVAADAAARADDPVDDLPAGSAILLDLDAERHATWEVRLFAS
ncbi:urease accessory protein UreF [Asanoa ishikariensis]|uniref:Urease accessory protein UreF n=1 Tax=Asanoa ishikariensis TaxID=137265 RepID=A0A1H3SCH1_9ACTN|nr:urease accessory UreF family protein [Asanoa ishikariensis]GIF70210.1 urease accessory protein UreF [Asanoa ishikariensis]SDZ35241.1 urease accessory protein [Asanoa ishikariensis]